MSSTLLKKRQRLIEKLRHLSPILKGSVAEVALTCGTPGCRCHSKGPKHKGTYFSYRADGKSHTVYLRKDIVAEAKRAQRNWLKMKDTLEQLTALEIEILRAKAKDGRSKIKRKE